MTYGIKMVVGDNKTLVATGLNKEEAHAKADEANEKAQEMGCAEYMKAVVVLEMNEHEKEINRLIQNAVSELIGGLENQMMDNEEGTEEYEEAKAMLNHDRLFDAIYDEVMSGSQGNYKSHIRFAGKAFIEDRIEARLEKEGYGA